MKSNNNLLVAGLSTLCLLLALTCGLLVVDRGGVLGESTTAMPRPITITPSRPSPYPTKEVPPTPTVSYPTPVSMNNVPCDVVTRIYTTYCRPVPSIYPTSIKITITPTRAPTTRYPTSIKITPTSTPAPTISYSY